MSLKNYIPTEETFKVLKVKVTQENLESNKGFNYPWPMLIVLTLALR